jgi:carboxylesterase type B
MLLRAFHTVKLFFVFGNLQNIKGTIRTPSTAEIAFSVSLMSHSARFAFTCGQNGAGVAQWAPKHPPPKPFWNQIRRCRCSPALTRVPRA